MKDLFGRETTVRQKVVIIEPYYHKYIFAEVIKITPKGVRVKYTQTWGTYREKDTCVYEWINVPPDFNGE